MTDKFVTTIGRSVGRVGGIINTPRGSVGKLISQVPAKPLVFLAATQAKNVAIGIRHDRVEGFFRDCVFAVDVSGAYPKAVLKVPRDAPFVEHTGNPIENEGDRKSTRLNSSHTVISYAVFCLKKKKKKT